MNGWEVERSVGSAAAFHHRDLTTVHAATVWIHYVERPALVLGSSQSDAIVRPERADELGVEVTGRRSGGGLVLVEPDVSVWIDVLIPPTNPLWEIDINRAFLWVGKVWRDALDALGTNGLSVHDGPLEGREHARTLCFAGIGPGEVVQTVGTRRTKIVGLSQRRVRNTVRFQGLLVTAQNADLVTELVDPAAWPDDLDPNATEAGLIAGSVDTARVADAFLDSLPDIG